MQKHLPSQRGLTLVEFMVSIVIGLIMVAAIATLIANQSQSRAEIDKTGKLIENGRYAVSTIASDLQMAGYYGEMSNTSIPTVPGTLPDPCATAVAGIDGALALHVQGYDAPATLPTAVAVCVKNHKPGTDVLVVRRADPETSDLETAGVVVWSKLKAGQVYLQTGLSTSGSNFEYVLAAADGATDAATFLKLKKDKATKATPRRFHVRLYYIAKCSVEVSGSCTGADGGTPIPTLKRVDLTYSGTSTAFTTITIAEGIEDLQVDYGVDTDADGYPDTALNGSTCIPDAPSYPNAACASGVAFTTTDWNNVMTMSVHLIARSTEKVPGFTDTNSYKLGTAAAASAPTGDESYRRKVFAQTVKIINPSGRRAF